MNILFITQGEKLKVKQKDICILKEDNEIVITPENITAIIIESVQCSITSGALLLCSEYDIPLIQCNSKAQPQVFCHDLFDYHKITSQLQQQIKWIDNPNTFDIYKAIIKAKLFHQLEVIQNLELSLKTQGYLKDYISTLKNKTSFSEVDNIEAICAKMYFKALFGNDFFRRVENDINASLNYGYAIIRSLIMSVIVTKGLHPSLGLWHHSQFNNYNLADDLIEIYRPMVDYLVVNAINGSKTFDKEFRKKLQHLLVQNVEMEGKVINVKQSIIYLCDNLIKAQKENDAQKFRVPHLKVELYEY